MSESAKISIENRKRKKVLKEITVSRAANGGHVVEHRFDNSGPGAYIDPETHVFGKADGKKVLAHIAQHMGMNDADGEEE
ncbi:MAG: hypothetical protein KGL39_14130 [Patescibacteria group bacterium]|nr:hypothetical protein [Patescibacteria group bacterium]